MTMIDEAECVVVGAGVVGLAVARELAMQDLSVLVVDSESCIGSGVSSRNSEVVHAGIYYPKDSLKARACVEGKQTLYEFCESHKVPFSRCGKLIVATSDEQVRQLEVIRQRAIVNGVNDLKMLYREEVAQLEPHLACRAALLSPSTGIVDTHSFMLALQGDAEAHGAALALNTKLQNAETDGEGAVLEFEDGYKLRARFLVNCGGLNSTEIARKFGATFADCTPRAYLAKGSYFSYAGKAPFGRLIYPVPEPGGLGVHATLDLGGRVRFGPDVEWVDTIDYAVDPDRGAHFYSRIRDYWPGLRDGDLVPDYSGVRPKISGPGEPPADFMVVGPDTHGVTGIVHCFGIESPGLTASMALARHVRSILGV